MGEATSEDLGRKVGSTLPTQRTFGNDPGVRHGAHRRRNVFTARLAANREVALRAFRKTEHEGEYRRTKGETSTVQILEILRPDPRVA